MRLDVAVCLPREAPSVGTIRKIATEMLAIIGVADGCIADIRLALGEACTNVVEHAAQADEYEVHLQVDGAQCAITVENAGYGFDAAALTGVMPDASSPRGRGVAIMHAVMDAVELRSEPAAGTIVRLVKTLRYRGDNSAAT